MSMMLDFDPSFEEDWEHYPGDGEFDSPADESYDDESAATRRRRARQRELQLRRRQLAAQAQRGRGAATRPQPKTAAAVVRKLDLEQKVQADSFQAAFAEQRGRQQRAELATVATAVANGAADSLQDAVELLRNPFARAAVTVVPLLLLPSRMRRNGGLGGCLSDPRLIGTALVFGLAVIGDQIGKADDVADIRISAPSEITVGDESIVLAEAFDKRGKLLQNTKIAFSVDRTDLVTIDESGRITALKTGAVVVTAAAESVSRRVVLTVRERAVDPGQL
jgi:hypothetical protein